MQKTNWHLGQKFVTCAYYVTDIKRLIEFWIDQTWTGFNDMVMLNSEYMYYGNKKNYDQLKKH